MVATSRPANGAATAGCTCLGVIGGALGSSERTLLEALGAALLHAQVSRVDGVACSPGGVSVCASAACRALRGRRRQPQRRRQVVLLVLLICPGKIEDEITLRISVCRLTDLGCIKEHLHFAAAPLRATIRHRGSNPSNNVIDRCAVTMSHHDHSVIAHVWWRWAWRWWRRDSGGGVRLHNRGGRGGASTTMQSAVAACGGASE